MRKIALATFVFIFSVEVFSQEPTRWRGPDANGIYPDRGLLTEWPENGPELLWKFEQMGEGFSSPAISGGYIYIPTMIDKTGYMFKLTMDGELVWRVEYGEEFHESYPGSRATATLVDDRLYFLSGRGKLLCMSTEDGSVIWTKHLVNDLNGVLNRYGFNETVVVEGDKIYCTPGGETQSVVALNRFTGEMVWAAEGKGDKAAYCTPLMLDFPSRKLLVTHTESYILGIDRQDGTLLWTHYWPNRRLEHQNTPLFVNGDLFCFSGYGKGAVMLSMNEDGSSVREKWVSETFDNRMGGAVLIDGYIYGCGHHNRSWQCLEWETGRQMYESTELTMGVVIAADGLIYCYDERGELALVEPNHNEFKIISRTSITEGTGQQWAHPVIHEGVLYISRGSTLMAFQIK
ncbi:MAG TPA: hypothetical protein ENN90_13480 [Mariniphaga anaerophila]|uniref:Pyrrolo-quinoline quinone repeat domain-containing protein n=1 Tax=Mariniphaga anaerophila TaxID=1484053 RepID=A0A831LTE3_9BACT|nr:hypothetical protein [Mariniphaga anaerophila]